MATVFLTLNLPAKGLAAGTPVVASRNPRLLAFFKRIVLIDWQHRIDSASDDVLAEIDRLEFEKLRSTLNLLIPDNLSSNELYE